MCWPFLNKKQRLEALLVVVVMEGSWDEEEKDIAYLVEGQGVSQEAGNFDQELESFVVGEIVVEERSAALVDD